MVVFGGTIGNGGAQPVPTEPPSSGTSGCPAGFRWLELPRSFQSSVGQAGWRAFYYCYYLLLLSFFPVSGSARPLNALNGDTARLYVNFKPTDKRFAFLLTSHGSFAH